jgi:hypothetical protein
MLLALDERIRLSDLDLEGDIGVIDWDRDNDVLDRLELESLEITPSSIEPYQEAVVSWEVTGPTGQVNLRLNSTPVEAQGSLTVSPLSTRTYMLQAVKSLAIRRLGAVELAVDDTECRQSLIPRHVVQNEIEDFLSERLQGSDQVDLDGFVSAAVDEDGISVHIPLEIEVPNWFNADLDVDVGMRVVARRDGPRSRIVAELVSVEVDVIWHWLEHVLSLGVTGALQAAMQRLLDLCITQMLGPQIEEQLASELQRVVDSLLSLMQATDADRREYLLTSLYTSSAGIEFTGCPEPEALRPPVLAGDFEAPVIAVATDEHD